MKLKVLGTPHIKASGDQKVCGTYNKTTGLTLVDIDCDIVTLCTVVEVLIQERDAFLDTLDDCTAAKIRRTTREAVYSEKH